MTPVELWAVTPVATATRGLALLLLFPLLGGLVLGLAGSTLMRRFGPRAVAAVGIGAMIATSLAGLFAFVRLVALPANARVLFERLFPVISLESLGVGWRVDFALTFDPLAAVFVLVITLVGTLIHLYAAGYMHDDAGIWRFFAYLNLFVFAMLLLVLGDSLVLVFFGWEGVGLCSYLLIGFWYGETDNARAANKAFIVNRVGDWGFLTGVLLLVAAFSGAFSAPTALLSGQRAVSVVAPPSAPTAAPAVAVGPTVSFRELGTLVAAEDAAGARPLARELAGTTLWGVPLPLFIALAFFLAMTGKSAQIPLHVWLPDAMAGPTPVSALIHAATMVTAGVYLAARLAFIFALSPAAATICALVGLATALAAGLMALVQHDIKKVLAYSTISQLGYMFVAVGVGAPGAAVFHVVTHACFKACLFLAAGSVIHALAGGVLAAPARPLTARQRRLSADPSDPQDLRNMGGLGKALPHTNLAFAIGAVALAGLPIAAGFYSKDEILWRALASVPGPLGPVIFALGLLAAGVTALYAARVYFLAFGGSPAPAQAHRGYLHEAPPIMTAPVLVLAAASILIGPLLGWPEAWGGTLPLEHFLAPVLPAPPVAARFGQHAGWAVLAAQLAGVAVAAAGWLLGRQLYRDPAASAARRAGWRQSWDGVHRALWNRLGFDDLYRELFVHPAGDFARATDWIDRRFVDRLIAAIGALARGFARMGAWLDRWVLDGIINGVADGALWSGRRLQRVQSGRLNQYTLGIAVGTALLVVVAWILR